MNFFKSLVIILPFLMSCGNNGIDPGSDDKPDNPDNGSGNSFVETEALKRIKGNSIQIDPNMLNQEGITPEEMIADLKMANIKSVHYFVAGYWDGSKNDELLRPEYLEALAEHDISVWLMLLGNCIYGTADLPNAWHMEFLTPYPGSISFYSFHHPEFVNWQVSRVKNAMENYDFVGIEFAESYFPEWKTIQGNGFYGDVSLYARTKFTREFLGQTSSAAYSFDYIRNDQVLYGKWMDFRVDAIINFNQKIRDAVKEKNPNTLYAAWGMGIRNGSLAEIRENFGLDMIRIAKEVKPDVLVLQTAAQDWLDQSLQYDYIKAYDKYVKALKEANPAVALSVQADIVSLGYSNQAVEKRGPEWWLNFFDLSLQSGYYTNTAYEYAFSKKDGIWLEKNLDDTTPRKLYTEPTLNSTILADHIRPIAFVREQGAHWKLVYTEVGLGWFYMD